MTINVGVIGTGDMGGRHAINFARTSGAQMVALMDVDEQRASTIAQNCGGAKIYNDATALIADDNVNAIVITSPDHTHAALAIQCINAGKPVLCEKPLATSAAEAHTVIDAEINAGRRLLQLGFMREYDPAHQAVKNTVASGQLGKPLLFRGVHINDRTAEWRSIEDVVTNSAIHDIHSARFMMPGEINSVYAQRIPAHVDRLDTSRLVTIHLNYDDGSLGIIQCNAASGYGYEVDVEITCETGVAHTHSLSSPLVKSNNLFGQWIEASWLQRFEQAYAIEAQAWIASLINNTPSGPSAWDGYASLLVADQCIASIQFGQPQSVNIPNIPKIYANT